MLSTAVSARGQAAQVTERHADLPGVRLFYIDTGGTGVPVVLLHCSHGQRPGLGTPDSRVHEGRLPRDLLRPPRLGPDRERRPARAPGTAADDLIALMDHLHIDRFHLVGTAAGGFVTFDTALSFPKRLRSFVVANSIGGVQDEAFLELGRRIRPPEFTAMPAELREVSPSYRAGNPEGTRRWVELEHASRPPGPPAPAQPLKNRITFALLETITVPAMLLTGDADMFAPPPVMRMFAARIKHAETVVVPEAGHSTYWEQPDVFNRAVLNFIRKH